jgi:hypothetical protein
VFSSVIVSIFAFPSQKNRFLAFSRPLVDEIEFWDRFWNNAFLKKPTRQYVLQLKKKNGHRRKWISFHYPHVIERFIECKSISIATSTQLICQHISGWIVTESHDRCETLLVSWFVHCLSFHVNLSWSYIDALCNFHLLHKPPSFLQISCPRRNESRCHSTGDQFLYVKDHFCTFYSFKVCLCIFHNLHKLPSYLQIFFLRS